MKNEYNYLTNELFPTPIGAYSNGISIPIGNRQLIILTGQQAIESNGHAAYPDDIEKQTVFIFERIQSLLSEANASLDDAIKIVIYLTDMNDFSKVSPIRNKYLNTSKPVSTLVEVSKLTIPGCNIEIDITALK